MTSSNPSPVLNQFIVATDFIKMHTMPDHRVYAVQQAETVVEGDVNCYTRHKGFFRDVISSSSIRHIVLTKTGYILVWMKFTKGFTLRLSRVTDISTETSALKYRTGQRCVVKMHFPFGTLNVILTNGQIAKWRNALIAGCDKKAAAPVPTPRNALVETATDLSLVPPLPQRSIITSTVVLHPPTSQSINEWRNGWADVDTITPPSHAPFRYSASNITIPRSKTFHVTKSTVLPSSLLGTNDPRVPVSSPSPFVSSDDVVNHGKSMEIRGQTNAVNGVKRSHTICVEIDGGMSVPIENEVKMENDRYSAVDRWLRSQIEKRVKKLDGLTNPPQDIDSDHHMTSTPRPRSRSANADMVSLRSNKRYSLV